MSTTTTYTGVRIVDMPDLGAITDDSSVVGEHAGSGRFAASALRSYVAAALQPVVDATLNNTGRNLLHNPLFNVAQRGPGPFTSGYTLDRWTSTASGGTVQVTAAPLSDADRAVIGDESAVQSYHNIFTGTSGTSDYIFVGWQAIEGVRRLGGKAVTVSFWAKAAALTPKLGVNLFQNFGTGGSPSAGVWTTAQVFTLSTTWTRFVSAPFVLPSTSGKTLGTNGNDFTQLVLWGSAGTGNNSIAGGIGVQSSTVDIWGVQLEIGNAATSLEKPDPQQDLAKCQRFYSIISIWLQAYAAASVPFGQTVTLPVAMRALPSIVFGSITYTNASGLALASNSNLSPAFVAIATSLGTVQVAATLAASADL